MEVKYLKELRDNPARNPNSSGYKGMNEPISLTEIEYLESLYGNNNPFPDTLRELLFLAGGYCYVCDYGIHNSQQELQESVRSDMSDYKRIINRPFFAIDVYNDGDQFLFVYLDEGHNPAVYEGHYFSRDDMPSWITLVSSTLSSYIVALINRVKEGLNPF